MQRYPIWRSCRSTLIQRPNRLEIDGGGAAPFSRWVLCGAYEGYFASSLAVVGVFTCVDVKSTCRQAPFWLTQTREDR